MPDPKITDTMQKIAELLRQADLAGVAFVASPSHTHYLHHIEASWTACRMESPTAMRLRCRRADYPTEAEWKETMRLSTGLLCGLHSALEHTAVALEVMLRQIGKRVEIEHMDKDEGAVPLQVEALRGPGLKPPAALKPDAEVFHPQDFLNAEQICDYLLQNRVIQFQISGPTMDRATALRHFKEREALILVKTLLLDEGERAMGDKPEHDR